MLAAAAPYLTGVCRQRCFIGNERRLTALHDPLWEGLDLLCWGMAGNESQMHAAAPPMIFSLASKTDGRAEAVGQVTCSSGTRLPVVAYMGVSAWSRVVGDLLSLSGFPSELWYTDTKMRFLSTSVGFHLQHGLQAAICEWYVLARSHVSFRDTAAMCSWSFRLNILLWILRWRPKLCLHVVRCAKASPRRGKAKARIHARCRMTLRRNSVWT